MKWRGGVYAIALVEGTRGKYSPLFRNEIRIRTTPLSRVKSNSILPQYQRSDETESGVGERTMENAIIGLVGDLPAVALLKYRWDIVGREEREKGDATFFENMLAYRYRAFYSYRHDRTIIFGVRRHEAR